MAPILGGLGGFVLGLVAGLVLTPAPAHAESIAFYYGEDVPVELLRVYERVVVEPDALRRAGTRPADLMTQRARLIAYVSMGELARGMRPPSFRREWVIGENRAWQSDVMDLTHPGWRRHLIEERMAPLWQQGFRGFFLDTLDSYQLAARSPERAAAQRAALISLIQETSKRFPGAELIVNRGFDILPSVASLVAGVVAESLYDRWDPAARRYVRVPAADREWLVSQLRQVRERHGLAVTVIDYRPPGERSQARATARKIAELGFDPWVTNASLTMVGVGAPELIPRRILVLHDGLRAPLDTARALSLLAPVLEYEGYVPVFHDVREPLPRGPLAGRYAGIVTWFQAPLDGRHDSRGDGDGRGDSDGKSTADRYRRWFVKRLDERMHIAIFGQVGFEISDNLLGRLGLARAARSTGVRAGDMKIAHASPLMGFEARPMAHRSLGPGLHAKKSDLRVHLRISDAQGPLRDPVITGPWGGMALEPHILRQGYQGELSWVLDPFAFVREALALEPMPVPDVTTEYGYRLLMTHVHGQGLDQPAELRGTPPARAVVRKLMAAHAWPHSTSEPSLARNMPHVVVREHGLTGPGSNITNARPSLTHIQPHARPISISWTHIQKRYSASDPDKNIVISFPVAAEDGFLADSAYAALGFRRVIETFELTDGTRRLLPIAIQYHTSSAVTAAGLRALEDIYAWARSRDTRPVFAWEYADRIRDFYTVILSRDLDGSTWRIYGLSALRTVRLQHGMGWPDLTRSPAVVSVSDLAQGRYVSFRNTPSVAITLVDERPSQPMIMGSNAEVLEFTVESRTRTRTRIRLRARGHLPVSLVIGNIAARECSLSSRGQRFRARSLDTPKLAWRLDISATDTRSSVVACKH